MTKEITKSFILPEIQDKFGLRELEPERFTFGEQVCPVYNIEQHLRSITGKSETKSITGTGGVLFYGVPATQKWFVNGYTVLFLAAGAYTVAGVYTTRYPSGASVFNYLDLTAAQSASYSVDLPKVLELAPNDALRINIDGYTSTADLRLNIDCEVETIR